MALSDLRIIALFLFTFFTAFFFYWGDSIRKAERPSLPQCLLSIYAENNF